jgi:hypothetical protein
LETVRWFNVRKGYGFIKRNGATEDILMTIWINSLMFVKEKRVWRQQILHIFVERVKRLKKHFHQQIFPQAPRLSGWRRMSKCRPTIPITSCLVIQHEERNKEIWNPSDYKWKHTAPKERKCLLRVHGPDN